MKASEAYERLKALPMFIEGKREKLPEVGSGFWPIEQKMLFNVITGAMVYPTTEKNTHGFFQSATYDADDKGLVVAFQIGSYATYAQSMTLTGEDLEKLVKVNEAHAKSLGCW